MTENTRPETLELAFDIDASPEKLWHALTDATVVERWLAPVVRQQPLPGDPGVCCEKLDADPGRQVRYRWHDSVNGEGIVTFTIAGRAVGLSQLSVVHQRLAIQPAVTISGAIGCRMKLDPRITPVHIPLLLLAA